MTNKFLNKLKKEEKLELVESSENVCNSYADKSNNCLKSAKLLLQNNLYENSIGMSYYAMYNLLQALLFKTGIKCENHDGSILILKLLFGEEDLHKVISDAKKERIDKQYYVTTEINGTIKEVANELLLIAENFSLKTKALIGNLDNDSITEIREKFKAFVGSKN